MEVLANASGVVINQGHFSNVGGNQYNYNYYRTDKGRNKKKKNNKDLLDLSEYREVKRGDIYKDKNVYYSWKLCSNKKDDTEAVVYYAKLNITGPFGEKEFTVKSYRGRNAMEEWRRDFSQCVLDWRGDIPLFGYNSSSVPSLIFCGELVPVAQIENELGRVVIFYIVLLGNSLACSRNELWLDTTRGKVIRGPLGPRCINWLDGDAVSELPTDIEFLKEDIIVRYFQSTKNDLPFMKALCHCGLLEHTNLSPPNKSMTEVFSSSLKSRIACLQKIRWWSFSNSLDDRQEMPDQTTRFRLVNNRYYMEVFSVTRRTAWLSQACSVFHSQNIGLSEDLSDFKLMEPYFTLKGGIQKCKQKRQRRELCGPIYLFYKASISGNSTQLHFWSLDKTGQNPLTQDMCTHLGLPSKFLPKASTLQYSWTSTAYQMIHDYQIARGFDPENTDFARYLGFHIYEVVPSRFEELTEVHGE